MIKIDQSLKGNEVVASVSKSAEKNQDIAPKTDDETVSVTELFGETKNDESERIQNGNSS